MSYDLKKCERTRLKKGWTKTQLAERAGVSKQMVSKFLSGESVSAPFAKQIVEALGLDMDEVVIEVA